jgi:integrase
MASLHARHSRNCPLHEFTAFEKPLDGCTCKPGPMYVLVVRNGRKSEKRSVGRNRKNAERSLRRVEVEVDEGSYRPQLNMRFEEWGKRWLKSLERKETTRDSYGSSVKYGTEAFGSKPVRQVHPQDIAALNVSLREAGLSDSTRAKHLRVLGACFGSAVKHGYAAVNPVRELPRGEKPRARDYKESAYFENAELPKLFAQVPEGVYRNLFMVALKTGMREGELAALTWGDVDLTGGYLHVGRSYTDGNLSGTKNHETRDVPLTEDVVALLGEWWGELASPAEANVLVFPGESGGYLSNTTILRRELYPAMARAGIERVGPTGEKRTFHSFRHTFAKRALESGAQLTWLSRHLGHSSIKVTMDVYGHFEKAERAKQAKLLEGAFGV